LYDMVMLFSCCYILLAIAVAKRIILSRLMIMIRPHIHFYDTHVTCACVAAELSLLLLHYLIIVFFAPLLSRLPAPGGARC